MIAMNITGVTQTAPILPDNQTAPQPKAVSQTGSQDQASGADAIYASMEASIQVMDMANTVFEDAANQLIASMAATTGVGQNIDMRA